MSEPIKRSQYSTTEIVMILQRMLPQTPKSLEHADLIGFAAERAIITTLTTMFHNGTAQEAIDVPI